MKGLDLQEYVIVADFDGTITLEDSNEAMFCILGNEENAQIEADYVAGLIHNQEAMRRQFRLLCITLAEYYAFLDANIHMDPGVDAFLQEVREQEIPLFIVSGGFRQGIERVLGDTRLSGVQVFANDLLEEGGRLVPSFALKNAVCTEPIGPCGNCKKACIDTIRRQSNRKIIYIGDGLTDRCVAYKTDLLFAKDALAAHCQALGVAYVPFAHFSDVTSYLWPE